MRNFDDQVQAARAGQSILEVVGPAGIEFTGNLFDCLEQRQQVSGRSGVGMVQHSATECCKNSSGQCR